MSPRLPAAPVRADSRWKAYPAYKDSGIEWLGEIPQSWQIKPLKHAARMNPSVMLEDTAPDFLLRYVDISSVNAEGRIGEIQEFRFKDAPSRARRRVRKGDTILSTVRTYLRAIAFIDDAPDNLIVSTGFAVLRPSSMIWPEFLWRMMQSAYFVDAVVAHSEGVGYPAINPGVLASLPAWIPPSLDEQRAIVRFIDRETAKLDALIAKKERLIQLLEEKRSALISHAVTKGLDPEAPTKDSGIEWLGEIPEHWKVVRFKFVFWLQRGHDLPITDFHEGEYPVCGSNGCIGYHNQFTTKGPGVTVGRSGSVGEVNYVDTDYWAHNTALYVKEFRRSIPRYAYYLLKTLDAKYLSEGTAVGTLNRNHIHNIPIAIPHVTEQNAITAFLDRKTAKIDGLITKVHQHIEKLREYRTALISAAVTGKIDVRADRPQ